MFQHKTRVLFLSSCALFLGGLVTAAPELPAVGSDAPAITATNWYNHLGQNPSLESLRGKTLLLEFWATW